VWAILFVVLVARGPSSILPFQQSPQADHLERDTGTLSIGVAFRRAGDLLMLPAMLLAWLRWEQPAFDYVALVARIFCVLALGTCCVLHFDFGHTPTLRAPEASALKSISIGISQATCSGNLSVSGSRRC